MFIFIPYGPHPMDDYNPAVIKKDFSLALRKIAGK